MLERRLGRRGIARVEYQETLALGGSWWPFGVSVATRAVVYPRWCIDQETVDIFLSGNGSNDSTIGRLVPQAHACTCRRTSALSQRLIEACLPKIARETIHSYQKLRFLALALTPHA